MAAVLTCAATNQKNNTAAKWENCSDSRFVCNAAIKALSATVKKNHRQIAEPGDWQP
ncbi:MAG: hypothetical protein IJ523_01760 [Succinivibrionaceae bacterium]|nr:hypothetical protein [Succinivibrionaceae bacterium]